MVVYSYACEQYSINLQTYEELLKCGLNILIHAFIVCVVSKMKKPSIQIFQLFWMRLIYTEWRPKMDTQPYWRLHTK